MADVIQLNKSDKPVDNPPDEKEEKMTTATAKKKTTSPTGRNSDNKSSQKFSGELSVLTEEEATKFLSDEKERNDNRVWAGGDRSILELDKSTDELIKQGAALIKRYEGNRKKILRALAIINVSLRVKLDDIKGEGQPFKQALAKMYKDAGVPSDTKSSLQTGIRYHVGVVLRETLTDAELRKHGYLVASQSQRQVQKASSNATGTSGTTPAAGADVSQPSGTTTTTQAEATANIPTDGFADLNIAYQHLKLARGKRFKDADNEKLFKQLKDISDYILTWAEKVESRLNIKPVERKKASGE